MQLTIGNVFSLGFGPFRWVCASGKEEDLLKTDQLAAEVIRKQLEETPSPEEEGNLRDNLTWVRRFHRWIYIKSVFKGSTVQAKM